MRFVLNALVRSKVKFERQNKDDEWIFTKVETGYNYYFHTL